ncbi:MAG: N-acetylneuraminic acid mutarotase [Crocinitomicaceae bacterium]|jgi:N-acetylneuraminic acid mutarotase
MIKKHFFLWSLLLLTTFVTGQENTWTQMEPFVVKRERAASFSLNGLGYLCAGLDTIVTKDLWVFDPIADSWSQLSDLPGVERRNPVGFSLAGKGYVGTGHSAQYSALGITLDDFYAYDPLLNTWTQISDYPGGGGNGIYFATAFATDNYGYVACGKKGTSNYEKDLWRYDPPTDSWLQRVNFPGGDRYNLMSFVVNNIAFVGFGSGQDVFEKDLWAYDEVSNTWDQRADCNGNERGAGGTFSLNGRGFICCGADGGFKEDLWEYDPNFDRWKIRAYFPTDGRRYGVSFSLNNKGYFGCGKGSFGQKRSMYEYESMSAFGWMMEEAALDELENSNTLIFPNPATNVVNVEWEENHSIDYLLMYNSIGAIVARYPVTGKSIQIDCSNQRVGSYILGMFNANNTLVSTHKIMLK